MKKKFSIQMVRPVYGPSLLLLLMACGGGSGSSSPGYLIITNSDYRATGSGGETDILPNGSSGKNPPPNVPVPRVPPTKTPTPSVLPTPTVPTVPPKNMPPTDLTLNPKSDSIKEGVHKIGKELATIRIIDEDGGEDNIITLSNIKLFEVIVVSVENGVYKLWLKPELTFDFDEAKKHVVKISVTTNPNLKQFFTLNIINVTDIPTPKIEAPLDFTIHERIGGYASSDIVYNVKPILDVSATNIIYSISDAKNIDGNGIPYFIIDENGYVRPNVEHGRQYFAHDMRQFYIFDVTVTFELDGKNIEITETITIYIKHVEMVKLAEINGEMKSIPFNSDGKYKFTPDQTKIDEYLKGLRDEYKGDLDEKITDGYLKGLIEKYQSDIIIVGSEYNDIIHGGSGKDIIYAGQGDDFVSAKNGNDTIYGFHGDDTLKGGPGNDILSGGANADKLDGGSGIDTAHYRLGVDVTSLIGVNVNLTTGKGSGNEAEGDTLKNIENILGSRNPDTLTGDHNDNVISGMASGDVIDGKEGFDTASYIGSDAGVAIDLASGSATGGHATGDMLVNIENLFGSSYDDILIGNERVNIFDGKNGSDTLTGESGGDKFVLVSSYSGTDTITDFSFEDGDKIRIFDDIDNPSTLEDIGLAVEERGQNAAIVSNRGEYQVYMILEDVDYTDISFAYFEVI